MANMNHASPRLRGILARMLFPVIFSAGLCLATSATVSAKEPALDVPHYVKDIAYGEILFDYYQQRYFSSITHTLVAQEQGRLDKHKDHAELLLGSLYISYGLLNEAESIFNRLIDRTTEKETRDQAWFYLAALHYKRGNYERTQEILSNQLDDLSADLENERKILNAILLMKDKNFDEAVNELSAIPRKSRLNTYAKYNMAVAFAGLGKGAKSTKLFDAILDSPKEDEEIAALKDKSALALGINFLRQEKYDFAIQTLNEIRLSSPFANPALLGLGWAHFSKENYQKSLTPWTELRSRDTVDRSVQESYLHIPYVYEQLGALQNALEGYMEAKTLFISEQDRIGAAIEIINSDEWIDSLSPPMDFTIDPLGHLPDFTPPKSLDAYYLYRFFASHKFNEGYRNYRELQRLKLLVLRWQEDMPVYDSMLNLNRQRLEELSPKATAILDDAMLKRNELDKNLNNLKPVRESALSGNNAAATATLQELETKYRLDNVNSLLESHSDSTFFDKQRKQLAFLKGVWSWDISENAGQRYWNIQKLNNAIQNEKQILDNQIHTLTVAHDSAEQRFQGFESRFSTLNSSLNNMLVRIGGNLTDHQNYMQTIATEILQSDIDHLERLKSEALLSIARLQDISYVMERRKKGLMPEYDQFEPQQQEQAPEKKRTFFDFKSWWE